MEVSYIDDNHLAIIYRIKVQNFKVKVQASFTDAISFNLQYIMQLMIMSLTAFKNWKIFSKAR